MEYYVPVANYFLAKENLTLNELQGLARRGALRVEQGETVNLKKLLRTDLSMAPAFKIGDPLKEGDVAIIKWSSLSPKYRTLSFEGKYLWAAPEDYGLKVKRSGKFESFNPKKVVHIKAVGDIMLSRHVNTQISKYGFDFPWLKTREWTADADLTFANLEVPLSDLVRPPAEGMSFVAPEKNLAYLKTAGIDVVSVANNHTANFGQKVFDDNLVNLKNAGLNPCGGGENESLSRQPVVAESRGLKIAFLCYNSIVGGLESTNGSSGVATVKIEPWFRDSTVDINKVKADILSAKKVADVVIVSPHWGVEYKPFPNSSQQKMAKAMIESGADLILGTHPHVVQGSEIIGGKYISYSLGNFIFDQEWSKETTEGVGLEAYFIGKKLVSSRLVPIKIKNFGQPSFSNDQSVLARIKENSKGF